MDLLTLTFFAAGIALLIAGGELLVRGASRLASAVGVSQLIIGLTVVAWGTGSPELAVTIGASFSGQADIPLGNVVGSNILNVLLILGLASLVKPMSVSRPLIRLHVPFMIAVSFLPLLMGLDGTIGRLDGLLLVACFVGYTIWSVRESRKEVARADRNERRDGKVPPLSGRVPVEKQCFLVAAGLIMLVIGSKWMISGAVAIAVSIGVSQLVIGLTVIAVGTSLGEVTTSIVAGIRGERDIAVGNVVGSNIFNILAALGIAAVIVPNGINVPAAALRFDIPVMIAVAVACFPIVFTGGVISRWEGALFLAYYTAYTLYLVLNAQGNSVLPAFRIVMMFVLPLTFVTLLVLLMRAARGTQSHATENTKTEDMTPTEE